jgi:hypothetical protein
MHVFMWRRELSTTGSDTFDLPLCMNVPYGGTVSGAPGGGLNFSQTAQTVPVYANPGTAIKCSVGYWAGGVPVGCGTGEAGTPPRSFLEMLGADSRCISPNVVFSPPLSFCTRQEQGQGIF